MLEAGDVSDVLTGVNDEHEVWPTVRLLPTRIRVLILRSHYKMKPAEIATACDTSIRTVYRILARFRAEI